MGSKGVLFVVAALSVIANRKVMATCEPCPSGEFVTCGTPPSCSYGVTTGLCSCGCKNACIKGPGEDCGGYFATGYRDYCVTGFKCQVPNRGDISSWGERGICVSDAPKDCSSPWFMVDNQCFLRVAEKWNWASALSYCKAIVPGAGLAKPNNIKALTAYLYLHYRNNGYNSVLWLGGSDSGREGTWHWINDATKITTGWQDNQPDNDITVNKDGQDCLTMWTGRGLGHKILADTNCEDTWNFLCERY